MHGNRTSAKNTGVVGNSKTGDAKCGALDSDLQEIINTWPRLSASTRLALLKLARQDAVEFNA